MAEAIDPMVLEKSRTCLLLVCFSHGPNNTPLERTEQVNKQAVKLPKMPSNFLMKEKNRKLYCTLQFYFRVVPFP